jgi:hypothetical protein
MGIISQYVRSGNVDFHAVNQAALGYLPSLVRTWLPQGQRRGHEWTALNPTRPDKRPGSFSVKLRTGRWADFATGDKGGDPISLAAYIYGTSQAGAARTLAVALGVEWRARP